VHPATEAARRGVERPLRLVVTTQQLADAPKEFRVARTGPLHIDVPLLRRPPVQGREEDGLGVFGELAHDPTSFAVRVCLQCGIATQITPRILRNLRDYFSRRSPPRPFSAPRAATPGRRTTSDRPWSARCRGPPQPGESSGRRSSAA